jgi:predicted ATPase
MIRSLRLQNFKCFTSQSFELGSLTLLAGLNGMGKSSMMQSLLLLRQSYQQRLLPNVGLALNGDLLRLGTAKDALCEWAEEEKIGFGLVLTSGVEGNWLFSYTPEAHVMELASPPVSSEIFEASLFSDHFHYLQAERVGPRVSFEMSDFDVRQHRQLGSRGEFTGHFLSVFGREDIPNIGLSHPKAESNKLRDQAEAWIGEVSPGTRLHFTPHVGMDLVNLEYSFVTGQQISNPYRSTNVGFGITYTLPVLIAILSSAAGSLVLLENPEAHLHPKGQVNMGELIARAASCGVQIIVETHSDHILNGIRLAVHAGKLPPDKIRLYFFERQEGEEQPRTGIISLSIDSDGRIDHWPAGFFDEWDKSLEALLEPRGV